MLQIRGHIFRFLLKFNPSQEKNAIRVLGKALTNYWSTLPNSLFKMRIDFLRFSNDVISPTEDSADAASFDLYSTKEVIRSSSSVRIIPTNIGFKIPKGCFCKIHPSSSLAMQFTDIGWAVMMLTLETLYLLYFQLFKQIFWSKKRPAFCGDNFLEDYKANPEASSYLRRQDWTWRRCLWIVSQVIWTWYWCFLIVICIMSEKILVNIYVPDYVPKDLKWYERDWLLTYIDQLKYERFISDPDNYLKKLKS